MKKCMHKIAHMPLQAYSIISCPSQMSQYACFSSKILCVVSFLIGNRVHVKSLGKAPGLAYARPPGQAAQNPGLTGQGNAPQWPGGVGGVGAGHSWN